MMKIPQNMPTVILEGGNFKKSEADCFIKDVSQSTDNKYITTYTDDKNYIHNGIYIKEDGLEWHYKNGYYMAPVHDSKDVTSGYRN